MIRKLLAELRARRARVDAAIAAVEALAVRPKPRREDFRPQTGCRHRTARELRVLREMYLAGGTIPQIQKRIGRSRIAIRQRTWKIGLRRTPEYFAEHCRFHPGHATWNKGLRRPGWAPGRMRETQFKKGQLNGRAARLWKPIGSTRINADGYLDRKVADTGYPPTDWKGEHILLWTAAHGPVPRGHAVVFKDGDKKNVTLENLECISRRELMARNTVHNLPAPLKEVIMLNGALKRRLGRMHGEKQAVGSARSSVRDDRSAAG